jgi:6,7-dimethyl-8-ribityllumazine synthase
MSNALVPRRRTFSDDKRTFMIVASQFNAEYVQGLVDHASAELRELAPTATVFLQRVPGAFEIPVIVKEVASQNKADVIIACGVILKGETDHAENLSRSVTDALQRIAVDYAVPVINAVLKFKEDKQAQERCLKDKINRGTEAARAAVEIANVIAELRK